MLRAILVRSSTVPRGTLTKAQTLQWLPSAAVTISRRSYADDKLPGQTVLPSSNTTPATPSSTTSIPPENIPKTPPTPQQAQQQTSPGTSLPSTSPGNRPPPNEGGSTPKPKRRRRFRNFLLLTSTFGILAYAGGLYYALQSDYFHDVFTEYVPGGEEAVLFFEEREFKRRFPNGAGGGSRFHPQVTGENKVTISGNSGASARTAANATSTSQTKPTKPERTAVKTEQKAPETQKVEKSKESAARTDSSKDQPKQSQQKKDVAAGKDGKKAETAPIASTKDGTPIGFIDLINLDNASDPVVQKVTKILNDLITVVNSDNNSNKYSSALSKAKDDLKTIGVDLAQYRSQEVQAAEEKIRQSQEQFDKGAKELLTRVQQEQQREQQEQELKWREEYEAERERLSQNYESKLKTEIEAAQKVAEQRTHNELVEQDIKLKENFAASIRERVENERDARLSKLNELSSAVSDLEKLTGQWNSVIDANLKTQHLVVAVDAVRTVLETAEYPKPFIHELAALKEVSLDDRVIEAAIASINPAAYQRGIPTSAQLVDRFRRVAEEVRKAALLPEDAGVASHVASVFLSRFMFKKEGLSAGDDVESVLTRTETLLEEGDLDEAAREMNGLTGWAKMLSQDWLKDCRRVLEVKQAMEVISTEARLQSLMVE